VRRGFQPDTVRQLKAAYRYLLVSKLNATQALDRIAQDGTLDSPEVRYLVSFIREAKRGVVLRRPARRSGESASDE
jgi:acyl-[acyl carrier protein]--UDP-N-acetylglucosamine O-acyltransferase